MAFGIAGRGNIDIADYSGDADAMRVAEALSAKGPITLARLEAGFSAAKSAGSPDAEVLKRMIVANRRGKPEGAKSVLDLQSSTEELKSKGQLFGEKVRASLDARIVGQAGPKQALVTALRASPPGRAARPSVLVVTGPSGVGKTEMAKAITETLHDTGTEPITLEGAMFKNASDLALLEGSPPGYVGSDKTDEIAPLSEQNIQKRFKGKKPIVLLIDEVDDIDPSCRSQFWSKMNKAIDEGYFKLKDGSTIDLQGAMIIITSNAGLNTVGNLQGEARAQHFAAEFEAAVPEKKILNRIGRANIIAMENLSKEALKEIVRDRFLKPYIKKIIQEKRVETGYDVSIDVSDKALSLLTELGHSDETGARNARQICEKILQPMLLDALEFAGDEDKITLEVKADVDEVARNKMVARFQKAKGLPPDVSVEASPFVTRTATSNRSFFAYGGQVPLSEIAPPIVHASGLFAGRGFLLYNQGESTSLNELAVLRPGPTEASDTFATIKLPKELAEANFALNAAPIDDTKLFLLSANVDLDAAPENAASQSAYVYDAVAKTFTSVPPPPMALVGATISVVAGQVLVTGGRRVERDEDGNWSVHLASGDDVPGAHYDNSNAIENVAWLYDVKSGAWEALTSAPAQGRVGAASVRIGEKIYLIGGEEIVAHESGTLYSRASTAVEVFDAKTKTFEDSGWALPAELAHATAFVDKDGCINVLGGVELQETGAKKSASSGFYRLDPSAKTPQWKKKQRLPMEGGALAYIPRLDGAVVGPDQNNAFAMMK